MLAILLLACAAGAAGTAGGCDATYEDNVLKLLTRYRAKDMCSCLFVMGQTKDYCSRWTRQPPNLATYTIDWDRQEVRTQAMMFWGARARFVDDRRDRRTDACSSTFGVGRTTGITGGLSNAMCWLTGSQLLACR